MAAPVVGLRLAYPGATVESVGVQTASTRARPNGDNSCQELIDGQSGGSDRTQLVV